jgi:zinc protease
MEVILAPRPGSGLVAATAVIRRGSVDEREGEKGIASYTTAMLMRGTRRRSSEQMAYDLESIGALAGDEDGMDTCSLSVRSAASEAPQALEILFEALREPAFDATEHETYRQELMAHLRMVEDDKFGFTFRNYLKVMFAGHGYGYPSEGEMADAEAITPEKCRAWHGEAVRPEAMLFVAAGDFEVDAWRAMLEQRVADWPANGSARPRVQAPPPAGHEPALTLTQPDLQQGFIVGGFRTPPVTHPDYPALRLASAALGEGFGGRIFTNLRDKKSLAYALGAALYSYRLTGQQILFIGTKPQTIEEARDGLLEEANYLKNNLLGEEELSRAREYVIGKFLMGHQSLAQRVGNMAWWEDTGGDAARDAAWPERLRQVTAAQVLEAARQWWNNPTMAVLRPREKGEG